MHRCDLNQGTPSRFILNLPEEELVSFERISFQVEQAYVYLTSNRCSLLLITNMALNSATGITRISSGKRSRAFHRWHSRPSPAISSTPVRYYNTGLLTTIKLSRSSSIIKRPYPYVGSLCWIQRGRRYAHAAWVRSNNMFS